MAIDPRNPSIVVGSSNTNYAAPVNGAYPPAYFYSGNGGRSFTVGNAPAAGSYTTGADTSIHIATSGTVFYSYLGETPAYCSGGRSAVLVTASYDHGHSYRRPTIVDSDPEDDKPFMAVRSIPNGHAHVYVAWTRWHSGGSDIWIARSTDGGWHFSAPRLLYSSALDNFGAVPVVGPGGRVYVVFSTFPEESLTVSSLDSILMVSSQDDGQHFGAVHRVAGSFHAVPRMASPYALRNFTLPSAVVGRSGAIYVSWAQTRNVLPSGQVNADIELTRSVNGGRSWVSPIRVNDVPNGDRFMPAITILHGGKIGVAFYDRRRRPDWLDLYAAAVSFKGRTTVARNVRLNASPSRVTDIHYYAPGSTCFSPGRFFGDYIGAAPGPGGELDVVWTDTQLHQPEETDLWFASVTIPQAGAP